MKNLSLKQLGIKLGLLAVLVLPELASAQTPVFNYNQVNGYLAGDLMAGFRKAVNPGKYELVVNLGSVTNFLNLSAGTTINITNYTSVQLTNAFADAPPALANLEWSVFSSCSASGGHPAYWNGFPGSTFWVTLPGTSVATQTTTPPSRSTVSAQSGPQTEISSVASGASTISADIGIASSSNSTMLVQESISLYGGVNGLTLSSYISDSISITNSDFAGESSSSGLGYNVENWTPNPFTSAQRSDFYEVCPSGYADPNSGSTTVSYFVGYFILNPNGSMTFTRASSVPAAPAAGSVTSTVTNGFGPLTVVFTNTATGSITNWIWSFGDGTIITNTTGNNVTNTYVASGTYTVTLTVNGPGGSSTNILASYIVTSPTPSLSNVTRFGGNLVFGGSNCPVGVQYRILSTTNLTTALTNWLPVLTNTFLSDGTFTYTNSATTNSAFFRLVSP